MVKLSIITASYNSNIYLERYLNKMVKQVNKITNSYELIIVDDGSRIDSRRHIKQFKKKFKNLKLVFLKKNYGQAVAFYEGIKVSKGKYFYTTDIDLEVNPKYLNTLFNRIIKTKKDCIFCINKKDNSKSKLEKILKFIFFSFARLFLNNSWLLQMSSTFAGTAKCRDIIKQINFNSKNLSILIFQLFNKDYIRINRTLLNKNSSYSFKKRFEIALDFIVRSFNIKNYNKKVNRIYKIIN